jgi:cytoskeletal protein RodZ
MDTPGNVLKAEREKQKRSLEEIARKLKINIEYLKAIEEDNYQILPAEVFTKAYISLYAEALGLESDYVLNLYRELYETKTIKKTPPARDKPVISIRVAGVIVILALFILSVVVFMKYKKQEPVEEFVTEVEEIVPVEELKSQEHTLKIEATELTWVSVSINGAKPKEWLLRAGDAVTLKAKEKFVIKIGNAGGTRLIFNNKDIGDLGPHGKVVDIVLP